MAIAGGDCPGLNAVIRATTKTGFWLGYDVVGFRDGFEGLIDPIRYQVLSPRNTAGILVQGGTILGSTNKGRFGARVGESGRAEIAPALVEQVAKTMERLKIEGLIVVGGDGSQNKQVRLGGIGQVVTDRLEQLCDQDVRCVVLGHLQRGGGPTTFDRVLASEYGAHAVSRAPSTFNLGGALMLCSNNRGVQRWIKKTVESHAKA